MRTTLLSLLAATAVACGPSPVENTGPEVLVNAVNPDGHAREVMVDCRDGAWTVHVRATEEVRAIEVLTEDSVSYATVDYPMRDDDGAIEAYGYLAYLPVVDTSEEVARHALVGGATTVSCRAGSLPVALNLLDDDFELLQCVSLDQDRVAPECVDYARFVTIRR